VARIVVLSGVTGVDDPWHDFTVTSSVIAAILTEAGWSCDVVSTARSEQAGLAEADLLVVNSGRAARLGESGRPVGPVTGRRGTAGAPAALLSYLASGRPVLGIHAAAATFAGVPQWTERLGVRWVEGTSMHPPIGWVTVMSGDSAEESALSVFDELYSFLEVRRPGDVLLSHHFRGVEHPLVLARDAGDGRTIYDALGHGPESYASRGRQDMLCRHVRWLLGSN
jgi:hypothetical protein